MLYYLKNTNKQYVFDKSSNKLFRVNGDKLVQLLMCAKNQYRITMPLSGERFRVTVSEIVDSMLGDIADNVTVPTFVDLDFQDDFEYENETAIKNTNICQMNTNGAVNRLNELPIHNITVEENLETLINAAEKIMDNIQMPEQTKNEKMYFVGINMQLMSYDEASDFAMELAKKNPYGVVYITSVQETLQTEIVRKKV